MKTPMTDAGGRHLIRPVLIGNLFQLHENSHDRRGRAASHYHYLIIYDIGNYVIIVDGSKSCQYHVRLETRITYQAQNNNSFV